MIRCHGLNLPLVQNGAVVTLCNLSVLTIELCCCLFSSLEQNRTLVASCKPNGFVATFVNQLCFLSSSSKSLQDVLFEPRLDDDDDDGDDDDDDDGDGDTDDDMVDDGEEDDVDDTDDDDGGGDDDHSP